MRSEPYLIQRMTKPRRGKDGKVFVNPFNFGGGYVNGGFTDKAWEIIKEIVAFDYMGSAEFEFGDLPRSFFQIAKNHTDYMAFWLLINSTPVHFICRKDMQTIVIEWLKKLSLGKCHLKEASHFQRAVGNLDKWDQDYLDREKKKDPTFTPHWMQTIGWIDIEHHFMFFTDKEIYEQFVNLFRIGLPDEKASFFKKILNFFNLAK
jgi:hypothetical protein